MPLFKTKSEKLERAQYELGGPLRVLEQAIGAHDKAKALHALKEIERVAVALGGRLDENFKSVATVAKAMQENRLNALVAPGFTPVPGGTAVKSIEQLTANGTPAEYLAKLQNQVDRVLGEQIKIVTKEEKAYKRSTLFSLVGYAALLGAGTLAGAHGVLAVVDKLNPGVINKDVLSNLSGGRVSGDMTAALGLLLVAVFVGAVQHYNKSQHNAKLKAEEKLEEAAPVVDPAAPAAART